MAKIRDDTNISLTFEMRDGVWDHGKLEFEQGVQDSSGNRATERRPFRFQMEEFLGFHSELFRFLNAIIQKREEDEPL